MVQMFWRLVHHLPWSIGRHLCDMCAEFGADPKRIALEMAEKHGADDRRIVGWSCQHLTMTTGGCYIGTVSTWCGCRMEPIYDEPTTYGGSTTLTLGG